MKNYITFSTLSQKITSVDPVMGGLKVFISVAPGAVLLCTFIGAIPAIGIYAALMTALLSVFSGGQAGFAKGATAAIVIVVVTTAHNLGLIHVFPMIILAGIILLLLDYIRLENLLRLVPRNLILILINVFIFIVFIFQYSELLLGNIIPNWVAGTPIIIIQCLLILIVLGKLALGKLNKPIQIVFLAILIVISIVFTFLFFANPTEGITSFEAFPLYQPTQVELTFGSIWKIIPAAISIAILDLINRLLTEEKPFVPYIGKVASKE